MTKLEQLKGKNSLPADAGRRPLIIAGPCSAETEERLLETAVALKEMGISYFRAGIWKPRTSPDSFEGVGSEGLAWLSNVKKSTGLKTAIEVANARHVEEALKADIDLLWLGARTSVNPFTVQEVADALKGVKKPILVKNPINPDLDLWKGALERVLRADVEQVIACHRGFNVYGKSILRNTPLWEIPIELKRQYPDLLMICDPSHIAGARDLVPVIAHKAMDIGYDGLMVETHHDPESAWSDAAQQLTPLMFETLLNSLHYRQHHVDNPDFSRKMAILREAIDSVDSRLMELLAERMDLAKKIGLIKKDNNVAFYQHSRWNDVLKHVLLHAEEHGLHEEFVKKLFSLIHMESIDIQGE